MKRRVLPLVCAMSLWGGAALAQVDVSAHASLTTGVSVETSGVHRVTGGALFSFGRVSVDAGVGGTLWNRWQEDRGTSSTSLDVGTNVRIDVLGKGLMRGPYIAIGASYVRMLDGAEKKLDDRLGRAEIGPNAFMGRFFLGYGFPTTKKITIAVTLGASYWRYQGGDFPPETPDPHPNPLVITVGLEFMRWR
jgi:hypothetical protein